MDTSHSLSTDDAWGAFTGVQKDGRTKTNTYNWPGFWSIESQPSAPHFNSQASQSISMPNDSICESYYTRVSAPEPQGLIGSELLETLHWLKFRQSLDSADALNHSEIINPEPWANSQELGNRPLLTAHRSQLENPVQQHYEQFASLRASSPYYSDVDEPPELSYSDSSRISSFSSSSLVSPGPTDPSDWEPLPLDQDESSNKFYHTRPSSTSFSQSWLEHSRSGACLYKDSEATGHSESVLGNPFSWHDHQPTEEDDFSRDAHYCDSKRFLSLAERTRLSVPESGTPDRLNNARPKRSVRSAKACENCRTTKSVCDEKSPQCTNCWKDNIECTYKGKTPEKKDQHMADLNDDAERSHIGSHCKWADTDRDAFSKSLCNLADKLLVLAHSQSLPPACSDTREIPPHTLPKAIERCTSQGGLCMSVTNANKDNSLSVERQSASCSRRQCRRGMASTDDSTTFRSTTLPCKLEQHADSGSDRVAPNSPSLAAETENMSCDALRRSTSLTCRLTDARSRMDKIQYPTAKLKPMIADEDCESPGDIGSDIESESDSEDETDDETTTLESSMKKPNDDERFDLFSRSVFPVNEGRKIIAQSLSELEGQVIDRVMQAFRALFDAKSPTNARTCASDSQTPASQTNSHTATPNISNSTKQGTKRPRDESDPSKEEDDDGDEENSRKRPKSSLDDSAANVEEQKLACPFHKDDPYTYCSNNVTGVKYRICAGTGFQNLHRIKEHLKRVHLAPIQCLRCFSSFKSDEELASHMQAEVVCKSEKPTKKSAGVTLSQLKQLSGLPRKNTEEEKWRKLYGILFPGKEAPSPYYEPTALWDIVALRSPGSENFAEFEAYLKDDVPDRVRDGLKKNLKTGLDVLQEYLAGLLPELIKDGIAQSAAAYQTRNSNENSDSCRNLETDIPNETQNTEDAVAKSERPPSSYEASSYRVNTVPPSYEDVPLSNDWQFQSSLPVGTGAATAPGDADAMSFSDSGYGTASLHSSLRKSFSDQSPTMEPSQMLLVDNHCWFPELESDGTNDNDMDLIFDPSDPCEEARRMGLTFR